MVIKAYSDSAAYLEAFKKFEISRKVTSEIKKSMDNKYLTAPTIFQLLNEKREDITYKVSFSSQDSLKAKISKRVNELPNVMQKPVEKNRQESDGK